MTFEARGSPDEAPYHDRLAREIIEAAYAVHGALGPGLTEDAYRQCLAHELTLRGMSMRAGVDLPVQYRGLRVEAGYRVDLLVEEVVIVAVKAVETASRLHEVQLRSQVRLSGLRLGLLINFNARLMKNGIHKVTPRP